MNGRTFKVITECTDLKGKKVIVRTSLDVPITDGVVTNAFRIKEALPTINYLRDAGARVILLTHVGRDPEETVTPVVTALSEYFPVQYVSSFEYSLVDAALHELKDGKVLMLPNLRRESGETENDRVFGKILALHGDIYVNDAFAVSHRAHASIVGIPMHLPSYAGITFVREYEELSKALSPEHPALFIIGGAKFETKLPLIEGYADMYEQVFVGGAIANDLIKAKGYDVGASLLSPIDLRGTSVMTKTNILTPTDIVVNGARGKCVIDVGDVKPDEKILDVGIISMEILKTHIAKAKTILWNGPLGYCEGGYDGATKTCAKLIAESDAFSIVGGGDTIAAIESLGLSGKFGFLSTAGGAMLEFLEKGTLPGITALEKQRP